MIIGLRLQKFNTIEYPYDIYFKEEVASRVKRFFYCSTFHCRITRIDKNFRLVLNSSRITGLTSIDVPIVWQ